MLRDYVSAWDPAKLCEHLETLELAVNCLSGSTPAKQKAGLVLLDGLAEALLLAMAKWMFANDDAIKRVIRPATPIEERSAIIWRFPRKLQFAAGDRVGLSQENVAILEAAHSCRNAALHHDRYRPSVVLATGALLFSAVTELLQVTFGRSGRAVTAPADWSVLSRFGISKAHEPYQCAIRILTDGLVTHLTITIPQALDLIGNDAEARVDGLKRSIATDFVGVAPSTVDALLKEQEFWLSFNDDTVSAEVRGHRYDIVSGKAVELDTYAAADLIYTQTVKAAFHRFAGSVAIARLTELERRVSALRTTDGVSEFLRVYAELDTHLLHYEKVFHETVLELDRRQQHEDDLARGK